jgi:hypothetical protein
MHVEDGEGRSEAAGKRMILAREEWPKDRGKSFGPAVACRTDGLSAPLSRQRPEQEQIRRDFGYPQFI